MKVLWRQRDIARRDAMLDDEADKPMFRRNGVAYEVVLQRRRPLLDGGFGRLLFHDRRQCGRRLLIDLYG